MNIRKQDSSTVSFSFDETTTIEDLTALLSVFAEVRGARKIFTLADRPSFSGAFARTSNILTHSVYNSIHSESQMLRYLYRLQRKDIALANSMIPLGSCTMKLNATAEMIPVTCPGFGDLHPCAAARRRWATRR